MKQRSEEGFTVLELMVGSVMLLAVLSAALSFFSKGQGIYTNERLTLELVQDMRTAFDRFTNEIRMAGSGLPAPRGVIQGSPTTLIVRGDFNNVSTIITSVSAITVSGSTATFPVGTTSGFAAGQTISLINNLTGVSALAKVTAVNTTNQTLGVDKDDLFPIESGAQLSDDPAANSFPPGLNFTYYKPDGSNAGIDADGNVIPAEAVKVQINLKARSASRDVQTGRYRTLNYTALIQVRGQYVPRVGF